MRRNAHFIPTEDLTVLHRLLERPGGGFVEGLESAIVRFGATDPGIAEELEEFRCAMLLLPPNARDELHLATFDLSPRCVPYLSVHLFGEESFRRAELMVGLAESYRRAGIESGRELPDHLLVVLAALPALPADEAADLVRLAVVPALEKMLESLQSCGNPYRFPLRAVAHLLGDPLHAAGAGSTVSP